MKVLLIGGGTGGHILPLSLLINIFKKKKDISMDLVVADNDLDREIINKNKKDFPVAKVHFLKTGKLRAYFSWENFTDLIVFIRGVFSAKKMLLSISPDIIFFKGGFIGFPFLLILSIKKFFGGKIPTIFLHESDISSGKLSLFFTSLAWKIFHQYGDSGYPLFQEIAKPKVKKNEKPESEEIISNKIPKILIFGGSQGAEFINKAIVKIAPKICLKNEIILITGKGKSVNFSQENFRQVEFFSSENFSQELSNADLIIMRGGASIWQIVSAKIPSIVIPLPNSARNHQLMNAKYFAQKNLCNLLEQDKCTEKTLLREIEKTLTNKELKKELENSVLKSAEKEIVEIMLSN